MKITKEIKNAIADILGSRIDSENYGMMSTYRVKPASYRVLHQNKISITSRLATTDEVLQDGEVIANVNYRYAAHKRNGMYKMLKPQIAYLY